MFTMKVSNGKTFQGKRRNYMRAENQQNSVSEHLEWVAESSLSTRGQPQSKDQDGGNVGFGP